MKIRLRRVCTFLVIATASCTIYAAGPGPVRQHSVKEIGINAVISTAFLNGIQTRIRAGKTDEALELIDAEFVRLLPQLREFDGEIARNPTYRDLRDRVVKSLQTRWLKEPPEYLNEDSAEYLERTCTTIPGCPRGRVHPLKQPTLPPAE